MGHRAQSKCSIFNIRESKQINLICFITRVLHVDECLFAAAVIFQYSIIANCDFQESKTSAALLISDIVLKSPILVAVAVCSPISK